MTQAEFIQAVNDVKSIIQGMDVKELEIIRETVSGELKLIRMIIDNKSPRVKL